MTNYLANNCFKWTDTPAGTYILTWEQKQLDFLVSGIFGYNAVQIGLPYSLSALRKSSISHRILFINGILNSTIENKNNIKKQYTNIDKIHKFNMEVGVNSIVVGTLSKLPFATQSIDLLVLLHTLELSEKAYLLLIEARRILTFNGFLVIVGFNSLSLWGIRRQLFSSLVKCLFIPTNRNLIAFTQIKKWTKTLGFQPTAGYFGCYKPPFISKKWLKKCEFIEKMGDRWWPIFGAIFLFTVIKI